MFEDKSYSVLMQSALARLPADMDKREGSMLWDGIAPAMAESALLYLGLDFVLQATYISSAPREYLIKRAAERGLTPKPASEAVFRAEFDVEVPVGSRFSCRDLNFVVTTKLADGWQVICETPGSLANSYAGQLIPIAYINGLTRAELVELRIPGDDEEETETLSANALRSVTICFNSIWPIISRILPSRVSCTLAIIFSSLSFKKNLAANAIISADCPTRNLTEASTLTLM